MKKERLDALSDGIFAIVMTLLIIEIRIPELEPTAGAAELFLGVIHLYPLFLSYLLSFALLFTYWRAHNYLVSYYAKNVDFKLSNINAVFFLFVALVPFSSHLLGAYSENQFAIFVISINTILIGLSLMWMRSYIIKSKTIDNVMFTAKNLRHGSIRTMVPVICAVIAMLLSFFDITVALGLFTIAVLFNFVPYSTDLVDRIVFRKQVVQERSDPSDTAV